PAGTGGCPRSPYDTRGKTPRPHARPGAPAPEPPRRTDSAVADAADRPRDATPPAPTATPRWPRLNPVGARREASRPEALRCAARGRPGTAASRDPPTGSRRPRQAEDRGRRD